MSAVPVNSLSVILLRHLIILREGLIIAVPKRDGGGESKMVLSNMA